MRQVGVGAKTRAKGGRKSTKNTERAREDRREQVLARIEQVRALQRAEGNFDCFGTAASGYCDQGECAYHAECLSLSMLAALPFP